MQVPAPSHWSRVHSRPSLVHGVPAGSKQLSAASLQWLHSVSGHGFPVWRHVPDPSQVSKPVQNRLSSQGIPALTLETKLHTPLPSHASAVHKLPSRSQLQPEGRFAAWKHCPSALHQSTVQGSPSRSQALPAGRYLQFTQQPAGPVGGSQSSPGSILPFPHRTVGVGVGVPVFGVKVAQLPPMQTANRTSVLPEGQLPPDA